MKHRLIEHVMTIWKKFDNYWTGFVQNISKCPENRRWLKEESFGMAASDGNQMIASHSKNESSTLKIYILPHVSVWCTAPKLSVCDRKWSEPVSLWSQSSSVSVRVYSPKLPNGVYTHARLEQSEKPWQTLHIPPARTRVWRRARFECDPLTSSSRLVCSRSTNLNWTLFRTSSSDSHVL